MISEPITEIAEPLPAPFTPADREVVISVRDVGKMYRIYEKPQDRLKQMLMWRFGRNYGHEFWAVRHVSLDVRRGETVGIIGRNGSGKSTLLQMIAGTLAPTEGEVVVRGRVAALLELGSGFNPEFTGRENVFLNGAILGISREEMAARFDEIAAFADIGEFIEQPVKTYSSGMYARLAFAIGIHIQPDIFIVDEALSVGDVFFQSRCIRKLDEYREAGGTVLFVTHDTYTLERICTRSIVIHTGNKYFEGNNADAVTAYYGLGRTDNTTAHRLETVPVSDTLDAAVISLRRDFVTGDGSAYIEEVSLLDDQGLPAQRFEIGDWMTVSLQARFNNDIDRFDIGIGLRDKAGVLIGGVHTFYSNQSFGPVKAGETQRITAKLQLSVAPNTYLLLIGIVRHTNLQEWHEFYTLWDCYAIEVKGTPQFWGQSYLAGKYL